MDSRQKAVKAFLDAVCCDDTILDRWIPNKDWVRQIRENGDTDCSTVNLNNGLSEQCMWQNNHATLQGATIFYNKKYVRTTKSKATANKQIRFYYVWSAGKPAPTIPSDQGFYQSLWDNLDRNNRTLKRTPAPQAKKASAATPPATKKAYIGTRDYQQSSIVAITTRVVQRGQPNGSRGLEGGISKPQIPCRVDWCVSEASFQEPPAWMHQLTNNSSKLKDAINKNLESQVLKE
jgi:hypothetical protein